MKLKTKTLGILSTLSLSVFLLTGKFLGESTWLVAWLFFASLSTLILLKRGFQMLSAIEDKHKAETSSLLRVHMLLHLVPVIYFSHAYFVPMTKFLNLAYLIPFVLFFYTGRKTWGGLFKVFKSKIYSLYEKGNRGFMFALPIQMALGFLVNDYFAVTFFPRLLTFYFISHFLQMGFVMFKIEKDLSKQNDV